jgi:hypothetical protein
MSNNAMSDSVTSDKICTCGHAHEAHTHYRRGTDCAICGADKCQAFSAARSGVEPTSTPARATTNN